MAIRSPPERTRQQNRRRLLRCSCPTPAVLVQTRQSSRAAGVVGSDGHGRDETRTRTSPMVVQRSSKELAWWGISAPPPNAESTTAPVSIGHGTYQGTQQQLNFRPRLSFAKCRFLFLTPRNRGRNRARYWDERRMGK